MKLPDVSSKFGAPMGRTNVLPEDENISCRLHIRELKWVDGDYDEGGAYWGGGMSDAIFWAHGDAGDVVVHVFVRAKFREDAKHLVKQILPNVKFYR